MEVTDVRLRRVDTEGRMRAIASITFEEAFVVHDIRVIDGNDGLFVAMPSKRTPDGEFRDVAHPINSTYAVKNSRRGSCCVSSYQPKRMRSSKKQMYNVIINIYIL